MMSHAGRTAFRSSTKGCNTPRLQKPSSAHSARHVLPSQEPFLYCSEHITSGSLRPLCHRAFRSRKRTRQKIFSGATWFIFLSAISTSLPEKTKPDCLFLTKPMLRLTSTSSAKSRGTSLALNRDDFERTQSCRFRSSSNRDSLARSKPRMFAFTP